MNVEQPSWAEGMISSVTPAGAAKEITTTVRPHPRRERVLDRPFGPTPLRDRLLTILCLLEIPQRKVIRFGIWEEQLADRWNTIDESTFTFEAAQNLIDAECQKTGVTQEQIETFESCPGNAYDEIFYQVPETLERLQYGILMDLPLEERIKILRAVIVPAVAA